VEDSVTHAFETGCIFYFVNVLCKLLQKPYPVHS